MLERVLGKASIRHKVVMQMVTQVVISLLLIMAITLYFISNHLHTQIGEQLDFQSRVLAEKLEQRLNYLMENTALLTRNDLMINALTDVSGRERYLPPLVKNFIEGKDVLSLSVVDFDGSSIFQTGDNIPGYNESTQLRAALAGNVTTIFISKVNNRLTIFAPIEYYSTTQGAVIVEFDLPAILRSNIPEDGVTAVRLFHGKQLLFEHSYQEKVNYRHNDHSKALSVSILEELDVYLDLAMPEEIYLQPVNEAISTFLLVGSLITLLSVFLASRTASKITAPILELYKRVRSANQDSEVLCSPLGSNDELEDLAKAFDERTLMLQYQAEHDTLTNLPNRVLFLDRLRQGIKKAERDNEKLAVLFVDLDRFKEVNDSYGHATGDELLQVVAMKTREVLRTSDSIARLGGDEFSIVLDGIEHEELLVDIVQKIMAVFKEPFLLEHNNFYVSCSVGIAVYPYNGKTPEELLKNADAAMYKAKDEGRNTYQFYTQDMTEKAFERVTLENQLRQAIVNNEFVVYFQPQYDIISNRIIGLEALIRWIHPEMGIVPPGRFIPLAEETGMIVEIDRQVMKMAMKQFTEWKQQGLVPGKLSMNLSMIQLNHEDFLDKVKITIFDAHVNTTDLVFEVTETQVMRNPERSIIMLKQLKKLGVGLAIDDFGTGHSSLSYLKRLPVDKVKIDQSFVRDIPFDNDDMELTSAIIALSKSLKLELIAEGVETTEQAEFLKENGCLQAQGYLYSKPENVETITEMLRNQGTSLVTPVLNPELTSKANSAST